MKWIEKAQAWLSQHPTAEALLWFVTAVACIAILVWVICAVFAEWDGAFSFCGGDASGEFLGSPRSASDAYFLTVAP